MHSCPQNLANVDVYLSTGPDYASGTKCNPAPIGVALSGEKLVVNCWAAGASAAAQYITVVRNTAKGVRVFCLGLT